MESYDPQRGLCGIVREREHMRNTGAGGSGALAYVHKGSKDFLIKINS